eukprot:Opistho-1_new@35712
MLKEIDAADIEAALHAKNIPDAHVALAMQLLQVDPARRVGAEAGASSPRGLPSTSALETAEAAAFQRHPAFAGVEWSLLAEKKSEPPFTPDTQELNFNPAYELEDMLIDNSPLRTHQEYGPTPRQRANSAMESSFAAFEYYDGEDPHSVAVNELARSMPPEEAREFREKMLRMHRADAASRRKLTLLPPRPLLRGATDVCESAPEPHRQPPARPRSRAD